jgi:hypothetical protein
LDYAKGDSKSVFSGAVSSLYEALDRLEAYVSTGVTDVDVKSVKDEYERSIKKTSESDRKLDMMLDSILRKRNAGMIPEDYGLCYVADQDKSQFLILAVPQRSI